MYEAAFLSDLGRGADPRDGWHLLDEELEEVAAVGHGDDLAVVSRSQPGPGPLDILQNRLAETVDHAVLGGDDLPHGSVVPLVVLVKPGEGVDFVILRVAVTPLGGAHAELCQTAHHRHGVAIFHGRLELLEPVEDLHEPGELASAVDQAEEDLLLQGWIVGSREATVLDPLHDVCFLLRFSQVLVPELRS